MSHLTNREVADDGTRPWVRVSTSRNRRWYVMRAEFEGCALLTVPCDMVDQTIDPERMQRLLNRVGKACLSCWCQTACHVEIYEDLGVDEMFDDNWDDEQCAAYTARTLAKVQGLHELVCQAKIYEMPHRTLFGPPSWDLVGWADGGSLLAHDAWLDNRLFAYGLGFVNEIRGLLGLNELDDAELKQILER
jgi:hypothetical protein